MSPLACTWDSPLAFQGNTTTYSKPAWVWAADLSQPCWEGSHIAKVIRVRLPYERLGLALVHERVIGSRLG